MSRALIGMMSSTATRSFACSVRPVETRSTIASARPTSGASSIDPYSLIRSTCMPLAAKCSRAVRTYLVATRMRAPRWTDRAPIVVAARGDDEPAAADAEIERLIQPFAAVLEQHVLAGDAEIGGAILNVGRHVGRAQDDERNAGNIGCDDQLARRSWIFGCNHPARASRGNVSSRRRPLESARVSVGTRRRNGGCQVHRFYRSVLTCLGSALVIVVGRHRRVGEPPTRASSSAGPARSCGGVAVPCEPARDIRRANRAIVAERQLHGERLVDVFDITHAEVDERRRARDR